MKKWLSFACLFSMLACAMAVTCQTGVKNYAVDSVADTTCTTSCMRIDYMAYTTGKGMTINFLQSSFSCTSHWFSCVDKLATCRRVTNIAQNAVRGYDIKIRNCQPTCCSTYRCNKPKEVYKLNYGSGNETVLPNALSTVMSIAMSTVPSTVSVAVASTMRPDLVETPRKGQYLRCHTGAINFAHDTYSSSSCTTACLTNDIDVTGIVKGHGISFPQTTFACAPSLDYCNSNIFCKKLEAVVSKLNIPSASNIQAENCKTKCCYSSKCNARDPSRKYTMQRQTTSLRTKLDPNAILSGPRNNLIRPLANFL